MSNVFLHAHATHPQPAMALALVAAQLDAASAQRPQFHPTLGLLYITDHYAEVAADLLADARQRWPGVVFCGTAAAGICATGVEYLDEPALVLMLCNLPPHVFRPFHGRQPLMPDDAWAALVHAEPTTPDIGDLVEELSGRTGSGYLFGGISSARRVRPQWAGDVIQGGLSGVGFARSVPIVSRVTQGCQPIGPARRVTDAEDNVVLGLDGQPALPVMLADLQVTLQQPEIALPRLAQTLAGITDADDAAHAHLNQFGADTRVRALMGLDTARAGVALGDRVEAGMQLSFCAQNVEAARRDLVRVCSEIREELDEAGDGHPGVSRIAGAVYVSCTGRGGPHFGGESAEMQIIRHALGDVPLVGFFAAGEIAHRHVYGYTGVLTVFATAT